MQRETDKTGRTSDLKEGVTSGTKSTTPALRLGPALFNIFINYTQCTLSKVASSREWEGVVDIPDSCTARETQTMLKKWATKNLMKFKKGKHEVQLLGRKIPDTSTHWELTSWKAACIKGAGVLVDPFSLSASSALILQRRVTASCALWETALPEK